MADSLKQVPFFGGGVMPQFLGAQELSPGHSSGHVQEVVTKTIPKKKRCKKAKWLSEKALQTAEKRRQAKGKGEKER